MNQQHESNVTLNLDNLTIEFATDEGLVRAVDGVSFSLNKGSMLGVVGESGCGKSVTALSIMRLLPRPPARFVAGQIVFEGKDLLTLPEESMRKLRGNRISMIFQEPMTSLNPVFTIGDQIAESVRLHQGLNRRDAKDKAIDMLKLVGIAAPSERVDNYPHELSGGMRQRVMIAMALACDPDILIADEPTTALDVTVQAQIMDLLKQLQTEMGMSIILITHDLGVVAGTCDDVVVMYAGKVVEQASVKTLFLSPEHPYTVGLLSSVAGLHAKGKPDASKRLPTIPGIVPNLLHLKAGCRFQDRCSFVTDICRGHEPELLFHDKHAVRCYHPVKSDRGVSHG